jgi:hypothetical protein
VRGTYSLVASKECRSDAATSNDVVAGGSAIGDPPTERIQGRSASLLDALIVVAPAHRAW